jgi:SAM-dependent methyltransferase
VKGGGRLLSCPLCAGPLKSHWGSATLSRCVTCGLAFRNPLPSRDALARMYDDAWQSPETRVEETGGTDERLGRVSAARLARELGRERLDGLRLLDFGAGTGRYAEALSKLGAEVDCVEPFGTAGLERKELRAVRSLGELPQELRYDGVVAAEVVEHLLAPWDDLRALWARLAPGGFLYLSTPNAGSLHARVKRAAWREAAKPAHVMFFTAESLELLLRRSGFSSSRRLRWFIRYNEGAVRRRANWLLQLTGLEGGLRYLATTADV